MLQANTSVDFLLCFEEYVFLMFDFLAIFQVLSLVLFVMCISGLGKTGKIAGLDRN